MINNTGQRLVVLTEDDGELLFRVNEGESINIRSIAQTKNDKFYSPLKKVNIKGRFTKVMDKEREIIAKFAKSPSVYMALQVMRTYIVPNYNVVLKDGKKYKITDLADDLGVTRQMAGKYIAKLKEARLIAEVETNKGRVIAINPNYYLKGDSVPENIEKLFL